MFVSEWDRDRLGEEICSRLDDPDYEKEKKEKILSFYLAGDPVSNLLDQVEGENR